MMTSTMRSLAEARLAARASSVLLLLALGWQASLASANGLASAITAGAGHHSMAHASSGQGTSMAFASSAQIQTPGRSTRFGWRPPVQHPLAQAQVQAQTQIQTPTPVQVHKQPSQPSEADQLLAQLSQLESRPSESLEDCANWFNANFHYQQLVGAAMSQHRAGELRKKEECDELQRLMVLRQRVANFATQARALYTQLTPVEQLVREHQDLEELAAGNEQLARDLHTLREMDPQTRSTLEELERFEANMGSMLSPVGSGQVGAEADGSDELAKIDSQLRRLVDNEAQLSEPELALLSELAEQVERALAEGQVSFYQGKFHYLSGTLDAARSVLLNRALAPPQEQSQVELEPQPEAHPQIAPQPQPHAQPQPQPQPQPQLQVQPQAQPQQQQQHHQQQQQPPTGAMAMVHATGAGAAHAMSGVGAMEPPQRSDDNDLIQPLPSLAPMNQFQQLQHMRQQLQQQMQQHMQQSQMHLPVTQVQATNQQPMGGMAMAQSMAGAFGSQALAHSAPAANPGQQQQH